MKHIALLAAAVCISIGTVRADDIVFNNGDKLSGTIVSMDQGTMTISSAVAGEVKVNMKDVKTFSTAGPVDIKLNDGTIIHQKVVGADQGKFALAAGGALQPQTLSMASISQINPVKEKWTGAVKMGAMVTRGNTFTDTINFSLDAVRRGEDDRITLGAGYIYGREKNTDTGISSTIAENWFATGQYDYFFAPKWYSYGNLRVEKDRIANLDLRFAPGGGVGYQWLESAQANFNTEAGLAWVYERYTDPDDTRQYVAARLAYHYDRKLNDRVSFFHNMEFIPSVENFKQFLVNADLGLRAMMSKDWFAEFKVEWKHNSQPPASKDRDDLRYVASVGWSF